MRPILGDVYTNIAGTGTDSPSYVPSYYREAPAAPWDGGQEFNVPAAPSSNSDWGPAIGSEEYNAMMKAAYNPQTNWSTDTLRNFYGQQLVDAQNFLGGLKKPSSTDTGYNPQAAIDAINQQYQSQFDLLNRGHQDALAQVGQRYQAYVQQLANDMAASQQRQAASRSEASRRFEQLTAGTAQRQQELANSMRGLGIEGAAQLALAGGNVEAMRASQNAQQNYLDRMNSIIEENRRQAEQQGGLIRQGAQSQLQQDYNRYTSALAQQQAAAIAKALTGGGGSGSSGSDKLSAAEKKLLAEDQALNDAYASGDFSSMFAALTKQNPDYAKWLTENVPEDQANNFAAWAMNPVRAALTPYISQQTMNESNLGSVYANLLSKIQNPRG